MDPLILGSLGLAIMLALIFLRMPIGLVMGAVGFAGLVYLCGFEVAFNNLAITAFGNTTIYALTVLPLFLLMGQITAEAVRETTGIPSLIIGCDPYDSREVPSEAIRAQISEFIEQVVL